jgi:hypothetical protein
VRVSFFLRRLRPGRRKDWLGGGSVDDVEDCLVTEDGANAGALPMTILFFEALDLGGDRLVVVFGHC